MEILKWGGQGEEDGQLPPREWGNWSDFGNWLSSLSVLILFERVSLLLLQYYSSSPNRSQCFSRGWGKTKALLVLLITTSGSVTAYLKELVSTHRLKMWTSFCQKPAPTNASHPRAARGLAGLLLLWLMGLAAPVLIWSEGKASLWGLGGLTGTFQSLLIWKGPRTLTPSRAW